MRLDDFIENLYKCGWNNSGDAQHMNIKNLHRQLFPSIAELEREIGECREDLNKALGIKEK